MRCETGFSMAGAVCCGLLAACVGCQALGAQSAEARAAGLTPNSSVTVAPVVLAGDASGDVGQVVGLMLEKGGMPNVWTTDAVFQPAADADLVQMAADFGAWAAEQKFETDCVVFGQAFGERGRGVDEVRAVIVSAAGDVIWTDRQTPDDAAFKRVKPRNPMTCCVLLSDRLKPQFALTAAMEGTVEDGRMARLWREKSGAPGSKTFDEMRARVEALRAVRDACNVLVYPVLLHKKSNADYGETLATKLAEELKLQTSAAPKALDLTIAPSSNEQKRLWDLARGVRDHVQQTRPDADYTLVAEYTIKPNGGQVWTVHFVVCDRAGEWVIVDYQNNHHADFNAVNPQNADDCATLIARRLRGYLN